MVILLRIKKKKKVTYEEVFSVGLCFLVKELLQVLMLRPVSTAHTRFQDVLLRLPVKEDQKA